ncbi:hypothetical protein N9W79_02525, partial [bacterium]|nr:hypothetical protein [bacterium]
PNTRFDLGCMTGGSSGSAATGLYMNLLSNRNLFPNAGNGYLYTLEEAKTVGLALKFLALTLDMTKLEGFKFFMKAFKQFVWNKAVDSKAGKKVAELKGNENANWWGGQPAEAQFMLDDFDKTMKLAHAITRKHLDVRMDTLKLNDFEASLYAARYKAAGHAKPNADGSFPSDKEILKEALILDLIESNSRDAAISNGFKKIYEAQVRKLKSISEPLIRSLAKAPSRLNQPQQEGFCTVTVGGLFDEKTEHLIYNAPQWKDLRILVICSGETISKILSSKLYRKHIKENNTNAKRLVFLESSETRTSINMSIREPGLLRELLNKAWSDDKDRSHESGMAIKSIYDPLQDKAGSFKPVPTSSHNPYIAVAGGFPDRRITAWAGSYYYDYKLSKVKNGHFTIFGKPDNPSIETFAVKAVKNFFSSPETSSKNLGEWMGIINGWCSGLGARFSSGNSSVETVAFNWDVTKIPAAQSGNSHKLVSKGINATRKQLGGYMGLNEKNISTVFDPEPSFKVLYKSQPCSKF